MNGSAGRVHELMVDLGSSRSVDTIYRTLLRRHQAAPAHLRALERMRRCREELAQLAELEDVEE